MPEALFLCPGCGTERPFWAMPKRARKGAGGWIVAERCYSCRHSKDADVRCYGTPGLDRLVDARLPTFFAEVIDDLDTPDPTNAELASKIRKKLGPALEKMLVRAEVTGDPKSITAALAALKEFEASGGGEQQPDWMLDTPAGATDSE